MTVELRLQIGLQEQGLAQRPSRNHGYRFARPNGWHCGHWHRTVEIAAACVRWTQAYASLARWTESYAGQAE